MRFVLFYHSLVSDWNHPSAHMLRGVASELLASGHAVRIFEPSDGWSLHNLREQGGDGVVKAFHSTYPTLRSSFYDPLTLDLDGALADADVVIAHEWNEPGFLRRLGEHRARSRAYRLLFHDSPHSGARMSLEVRTQALQAFDGVLAASDALRRTYREQDGPNRWTWRDAVDVRVFRPSPGEPALSRDLIWVGSWDVGERLGELDEFLIEPIRALGLRARFYGARYPQQALRSLRSAGIEYGGWIPDFCVPAALSAARFTVHVPLRLRADGLPAHVPAMPVLQALACGVPVVTAPWDDCAELFESEDDLLIGRNGPEMTRHLAALRSDPEFRQFVAANGYRTVMGRHTCAHRARELLSICRELRVSDSRRRSQHDDPAAVLPVFPYRPPRGQLSHAPAAWN
ncbi:MAG TPA: glycosyltransferase [Steroidobacteraceae bacterium]|nr:glycosyltransferase [Steroidobacteraceae bacterium]